MDLTTAHVQGRPSWLVCLALGHEMNPQGLANVLSLQASACNALPSKVETAVGGEARGPEVTSPGLQ
jgi:hypothetical protein